jgi:hypothetical protein
VDALRRVADQDRVAYHGDGAERDDEDAAPLRFVGDVGGDQVGYGA